VNGAGGRERERERERAGPGLPGRDQGRGLGGIRPRSGPHRYADLQHHWRDAYCRNGWSGARGRGAARARL